MNRTSDITNQQNKGDIMGKIEQKLNTVETVNMESKPVEVVEGKLVEVVESEPVEIVESKPAEIVDVKFEGITNETLPEIQPGDKEALLCIRDGYKLYMMPAVDTATMIVEGCKFYLEHEGQLMIGAGHELSISKERILRASDHAIMGILNKYAVNFTEDDLKIAFERARRFLENMREMALRKNSLSIQEAYAEVIRFAKYQSDQEDLNELRQRNCKYDREEQTVSIRDNYFQTVLDRVESGYTKVVFCKKLAMVAQHYGKELLISNKGRYTFNETGNNRWYKLKVVDELMNEDGGEA